MQSAAARSADRPEPTPTSAPNRPAGPPAGGVQARKPGRGLDDRWPVLALLLGPVALTIWGWSYYAAPLGARLRHPLHAMLKPSGPVGLGLGVVAFALFVFLWLYAIRRSVSWLAWTGSVGNWLRIHIIAGLGVPVIAAVHAGWRFDGFIGLGYLAMLLVSMSGVVGRYLYTHIPRRKNGVELSLDEANGERRTLLTQIGATTGLEPASVERALAPDPRSYAGLNLLQTIGRMLEEDMQRVALLSRLQREWSRPRADGRRVDPKALREALRLARREMALTQQVRVLERTRRLFALWHVAHRPFAITALIAVLLHVVIAVWVGGVGTGTAARP